MKIHIEMLKKLGKKCIVEGDKIVITYSSELKNELIWEGHSIRNTLLIFGASLTRNKKARVPLPGGCKIGERK
jgi:UDP-N-acetylglucosamine 1-carboxyvinyltransferase